jgi:molecular chaperone GrpE (heat shock protein)
MGFRDTLSSAIARLWAPHALEPAWKQDLRRECLAWIEELDEPPGVESQEDQALEPDLHTLFREVAALRTDTRKSARHAHESAAGLHRELGELTTAVTTSLEALTKPRDAGERAREILEKKKNFLPLVELLDRLLRVREQLDTLSIPGGLLSWNGGASRKKLARIREGMALLCERYERLLEANGVTKRTTVGTPFDPMTMNGIERTVTGEVEPGTVLEEYSGAYLIGDHVLKSAAVRVAASPER